MFLITTFKLAYKCTENDHEKQHFKRTTNFRIAHQTKRSRPTNTTSYKSRYTNNLSRTKKECGKRDSEGIDEMISKLTIEKCK